MKKIILFLLLIVVFSATNTFAQISECWQVDINYLNTHRNLYENDLEAYVNKLNNGKIEYNSQYIPDNLSYIYHSLFDSLCLKKYCSNSEIYTHIDVSFAYSFDFTSKSFINYTDTISVYNKQMSEIDFEINDTICLPIKKMLNDYRLSLVLNTENETYIREYFMILIFVYLKDDSGNLYLNKFYIPINDDYLYKIEVDYEN